MKVMVRRVMTLITRPAILLLWGCSEGGGGPADDTHAFAQVIHHDPPLVAAQTAQ